MLGMGREGRGEMVRVAPEADDDAGTLRLWAGVVTCDEGMDGSLRLGTVSLSGDDGAGEGGSSNEEIDVNGLMGRNEDTECQLVLSAQPGVVPEAARCAYSASRSYASSNSSQTWTCSSSSSSFGPAARYFWITSYSSRRFVACSPLSVLHGQKVNSKWLVSRASGRPARGRKGRAGDRELNARSSRPLEINENLENLVLGRDLRWHTAWSASAQERASRAHDSARV